MNTAALVNIVISEIARYDGFKAEPARLGDYEAIRVSRGECVFDMVLHPMLEARFIDYVGLVLDCVAMYAAKLEVVRNAVPRDR